MAKSLKRKGGEKGMRITPADLMKNKKLRMGRASPPRVTVPGDAVEGLSTPTPVLAEGNVREEGRNTEAATSGESTPMDVDTPTTPPAKKLTGFKAACNRVVSAVSPYKASWGYSTPRKAQHSMPSSVASTPPPAGFASPGATNDPTERTPRAGRIACQGELHESSSFIPQFPVTVEEVEDEDAPRHADDADDEDDAEEEGEWRWDPAFAEDVDIPRADAHLPSAKMRYFRACQESNAQVYMDRREKPPANLEQCSKCQVSLAAQPAERRTVYRCLDCQQVTGTCADCVLRSHEDRPFDRLAAWSPELGFWQKKTVADLAFVWHLGHGGGVCPTNHSPPRPMVFLHEHGIMDLSVKFCQCIGGASEPEQLIEHGCWPATWKSPHTAITLGTMATFHGLEMQGQLNVHDYIRFLRRMTDAVAPDAVKDRYREFNNSMREYRQVRARRRHGAKPGTVPGPGELAVLCPACPQPGKNMRPGWQDRQKEYRYIDALTYSIDGNFHLGLKAKETDEKDEALSEGAAYFVNSKDFATYLKKSPEPPAEESTCNQFGAMGQGKYKGKVSGVIALTCRHMFLLPGGVVDLRNAEAYRYTDFALVSALQPYIILLLLMGTYDIHCQYIKNLRARLESQFGVVLDELDSIVAHELPEIVAGVGKYHLCMHKGECRTRHSMNFLPGAAMSDGEMLERIWAVMNGVARRTKEMSAGHRKDVLNDHYSDLNVRRVHSMVTDLMEKLRKAGEMADLTETYLAKVEEKIDEQDLAAWRDAERVWKEKVVDISCHKGLENPYELPQDASLTTQDIRAQLVQEAEQAGKSDANGDVSVVHTVLQLREQQTKLRADVEAFQAGKGTDKERKSLEMRLETFREEARACRSEYAATIEPAVEAAVADVDAEKRSANYPDRDDADDIAHGIAAGPPEKLKKPKGRAGTKKAAAVANMLAILEGGSFRLPSDCHSSVRLHPDMAGFVKIELALRKGQANEALDAVRLHTTTQLALKVRKEQAAGVKHNTEADRRIEEKRAVMHAWREKYRSLRVLLRVLGMPEDDKTYQVLRDEDCTAFAIIVTEGRLGTSYRLPSWIWGDYSFIKKMDDGAVKTFVGQALRAHWFRYSALKTRWAEEVNLRLEEMWRTSAFFRYYERAWQERARFWESKGAGMAGTCVAARRQAHRWTRLRQDAEATFPEGIHIAVGIPGSAGEKAAEGKEVSG